MGFRFRKSFSVFGIKFNVSNTGVSASAKLGPVRHTVSSSGRQTTTIKTPIPGVNYVHTESKNKRDESFFGKKKK